MDKKKFLFCESCNPKRFFQMDRRKTSEDNQKKQILPSPKKEQRSNPDRRKIQDRRIGSKLLTDVDERRSTAGRRPYDGNVWFEGVIEDAIREGWDTGNAEHRVICPKCQNKVP